MKSKCLSALIIAVLCVAPGMVRGEEFVTSYWYGPPVEFATFERYQEIKEAGFNVVFPPALGNAPVAVNRRILDYCAKLGMRAVISDARMPVTIEGDAKKRIDAI